MSPRKTRVLQLVNSFALGGAERVVTMLATHADRSRFEVIPCAIRASGPLEEDLQAAGIQYQVLGIRRRNITNPLFLADFRRLLAGIVETAIRFRIDIIHAHLTENTLLAVLAGRRLENLRVCATVHSVVFSPRRGPFSFRSWLKRTAIERVFSRTDRIIAVSDEVARAVQATSRVPPEHITTIPNGVEPNPYRAEKDRMALRRSLDLPLNRPVVASVGRLIHLKGYQHLEAALALIPSERRPLTLFIGDGPDRSELESRAAVLGLSDDVRFLGYRRDVAAVLAASDLFVLPSLWEGLPLSLLEAMSAGLPVVVTSVGGNAEVVEEGKSGLLIPPRDEPALANAITSLLENPFRRLAIGKAARDRFDRCFSLNSFIRSHEYLYEELLAKPSLPRRQNNERAFNFG
jgi:glycosyltransferase involved in cell wall biosynthesis